MLPPTLLSNRDLGTLLETRGDLDGVASGQSFLRGRATSSPSVTLTAPNNFSVNAGPSITVNIPSSDQAFYIVEIWAACDAQISASGAGLATAAMQVWKNGYARTGESYSSYADYNATAAGTSPPIRLQLPGWNTFTVQPAIDGVSPTFQARYTYYTGAGYVTTGASVSNHMIQWRMFRAT